MGLPFASAYTVRVYTVGYTSGRAVESGPTSQAIQAVVTPLDDRALQRLPEGLRAGARFLVRTTTALGDLGDAGDTADTRIVVDGLEYQLEAWGRWGVTAFGALRHQKYVAREVVA